MKPVHLCIPVLKRYDMLGELLRSLRNSTVIPQTIHIIDNGRDRPSLQKAILDNAPDCGMDVMTPNRPMGVAEAWNWFLQNAPEERIISNDDILFGTTSIEKLISVREDVAFAAGVGFSCFMIRDACVKVVGLFDETISPGYAYYEDEDYMTRMRRDRVSMIDVDSGVEHRRSSTLAMNTPEEMAEHHRKFRIAQGNYVRKWGGMPEQVKASYPREVVEVQG